MKKKLNQIKLAGFLSIAFLLCGIGAAAQETNRTRVSPRPTPPTEATPQPTVSPTPFPTPVPIQTAADLQSRILSSLQQADLRRGHVGVKIVSLDSGRTFFEQNSEKYFMPASNMKVFTVAAALQKLSPNFRFATSVYADELPDSNGTIRGDLSVFGRGDITISSSFNDGDYFKGLDELAEKIVGAGVKKIEGSLIGDESYFTGNAIPDGWEWDDLQWYYGAEISALSVNDNAVDLSVKPGSNEGAPCAVQILPVNKFVRTINTCKTSSARQKRELKIHKRLDQNIIEISGTMPAGDTGFSGYVSVTHPADVFIELLRQRLEAKGVTITGQSRVAKTIKQNTSAKIEIAKLESTPLSIIAAKTLKPSQNLYTETLLWTLGEELGAKDTNSKSVEKGVSVVQNFLREIGVPSDSVIQYDGSGLSRHNLVTPAAVVAVYTYMSKSPYAAVWENAQTVGGIDGTLKNRFKQTNAEGNVRGKTGTIDQVSSLSGYVTSASGEKFVFSIIVNGVNSLAVRKDTIDKIVVALADFNGKTN